MPRRKGESPKRRRPAKKAAPATPQPLRQVLAVTMENVAELQLTSAVMDMAVLLLFPPLQGGGFGGVFAGMHPKDALFAKLSINRVHQAIQSLGPQKALALRERYATLLEHVDPQGREEGLD